MLVAESLMGPLTALGCEAKGEWSTSKATILDFILSAVYRCVSGETMRSFSAIKNQDGFSRHAGFVMGSPRHLSAIGFWVAAIIAGSSVHASGPMALRNPSAVTQPTPPASDSRFASSRSHP